MFVLIIKKGDKYMKKRLLAALLAGTMVLGLTGCEITEINEITSKTITNDQVANTAEETGEIKVMSPEDGGDVISFVDEAIAKVNLNDIAGVYEDSVSQRASAEVKNNDDGTYNIQVFWGSSAFESYVWTMNASYDASTNRLVYNDCTKVIQTYSEDAATTIEEEYADGEGYFEIDGSNLKWTGAGDKDCQDCIFEKGEYDPPLEGFIPNDFLQERTGKDEFDSYDDICDSLIDGEGYAYIELTGYKGKLLAITDATYDYGDGNLASIAVSIYAKEKDGVVRNIGNASTMGTAYPIRCQDGVLYMGGHHEYTEMFVSKEYQSLMCKKIVSRSYDEDGNPSFFGTEREENTFSCKELDVDIDNDEEFEILFEELETKRVINFVVKGK